MSQACASSDNKSRRFRLKKDRNFFESRDCEGSPLVRSTQLWSIVSSQLECLLGETIHRQWFSPIVPIVVSNDVLILKTANEASTRWINAHYSLVIDKLLQLHDPDLSAFFISSQDIDENTGSW